MKTVIVIPARGGSKGLKNKNILPLMGKPLIGYTIEAALESQLSDKIVVSTDDDKIAECAADYGIFVIKRPPEYSTDDAPIELALRHAVKSLKSNEGFEPEYIVWLQANVPLRKKGQIDTAIKKLIETGADSVLTLTEVSQRPEFMKTMSNDGKISHCSNPKEYRRQSFSEKLFIADGAIIVMKTEVLMCTEGLTGAHVYLGKDIRGIIQESRYAIEIDDQFDYDVVMGLLLVDKMKQ